MKNVKGIVTLVAVIGMVGLISGFKNEDKPCKKSDSRVAVIEPQTINLFVTHGHCSTPFRGKVNNLNIEYAKQEDQGNPLENMRVSFDVNPNSFNVCSGPELTARIKTPGLFIGGYNENITFRSTQVYTMGLDWYQVNGKLSIKGVEKNVKLFATGIREPNETNSSYLVFEGQMDLTDWGIDYDKIVNGKSDSVPTKWMHLNMKVKVS